MTNSPYQPPLGNTRDAVEESVLKPSYHSLPPYAQLGLRLLGVMLVVDGISAAIGGLTHAIFQAREYSMGGYAYTFDPHSAGWIAGGIPHLIVGLYLTVDGRWVMSHIFTPSRHHENSNPDDADVADAPPV